MKKYLFFGVLLVVFSCGKKEENVVEKAESIEKTVVSDSVNPAIVGADEDSHGCKPSTGYTWSELKKECVRVFEIGNKLNPYEVEQTTVAYVIFDGDQAELFLPNEKSSIMLVRKEEGMPFDNGDWSLIPWKGYVLKKAGKIQYIGQ